MSSKTERRDAEYAEDIRQSVARVFQYIQGLKKLDFIADHEKQDAVIRNLGIIGEASSKLSSEFKKSYPEIDWKGFIGLRNIVIHRYWQQDFDIIWEIIKKELPEMRRALRQKK
jgi:uncharacterized protein with HEPN domain